MQSDSQHIEKRNGYQHRFCVISDVQEHNTTVWSFLQVVLEQVKLQHPHVTNDKGTLFHRRLRRSIREQIQLLQSMSPF